MKKLFFSFFLAASLSVSWNVIAQQRLVLVEEFTGENCGPCAGANPALNALIDANASKAMLIRYQVPIPTAGPIHNQNTAEPMSRLFYYNCNFAPWGQVDGKVVGGGPYPAMVTEIGQSEIDAAYAVASPFSVGVAAAYNAAKDSIISTIVLTANSAFSPTGVQLKLQVALLESLHFATPPGSNGETDFEHVVRKMFPSTAGTALTGSWTSNQTQTFTIKGAVPAFVDKSNEVLIAVWIQDDATKEVHGAARSANLATTSISSRIADAADGLNLYPNPAKDKANIEIELKTAQVVQLVVRDATGRTVYSGHEQRLNAGLASLSIPVAQLPAGLYNVSLVMDGGYLNHLLSVVR